MAEKISGSPEGITQTKQIQLSTEQLLRNALADKRISPEEAGEILNRFKIEKGHITSQARNEWKSLSLDIKRGLKHSLDIHHSKDLLKDVLNRLQKTTKENGVLRSKIAQHRNVGVPTDTSIMSDKLIAQTDSLIDVVRVPEVIQEAEARVIEYLRLVENPETKKQKPSEDIESDTKGSRVFVDLQAVATQVLMRANTSYSDIQRGPGGYAEIYDDKDVNTVISTVVNSKNEQEFITNLRAGVKDEKTLLRQITALGALLENRMYDWSLLREGQKGPATALNAANRTIGKKTDGAQMFVALRETLLTNTPVEDAVCVQHHTWLAQIMQSLGYQSAKTGTIDIGVQHRFASVQGKDGKTYILSYGEIYSGDNYNQAYTAYQEKKGTMSFYSDVFDSNNKLLGTYQTDTQRKYADSISAGGKLNQLDQTETILGVDGFGNKVGKDVKISVGNQGMSASVGTFDGRKGYEMGVSQQKIAAEGTKLSEIHASAAQEFLSGKIGLKEKISVGNVDFSGGNKTGYYGASVEMGYRQQFNEKGEGLFGGIAANTELNVAGLRKSKDAQVPVTNVDLGSAARGKVGVRGKSGEVFVEGGVAGNVLNATNHVSGWKASGVGFDAKIGGSYKLSDTSLVSGSFKYQDYRGNKTTEIKGSYQDKESGLMIGIEDKKEQTPIDLTRETRGAFFEKRIKSAIFPTGTASVYGSLTENKIGGSMKDRSATAGIKFRFK